MGDRRLDNRPRAPREVPYDIGERAFQFAARVVHFVRRLPQDAGTPVLSPQLLRSATSVGANVEEADGTLTARECAYRRAAARKEARESRYWLCLVRPTLSDSDECRALEQESEELARILSTLTARNMPPPCA